MIDISTIDPVAFSIGPVAVRWYSLAYLAGFLLGWWGCRMLASQAWPRLKPDHFDDLLTYMILAVILGGRLGYVLFYKPGYYLSNPLEIPAIWTGGMSFHGGFLGAVICALLFARARQIDWRQLADILAIVTPIGIFFGRLSNFINGELWGRPTDLPWGVIFPHAGPEPRHPSQLYEAVGEGLLLFILLAGLWWLLPKLRGRHGVFAGLFILGYGAVRAGVELVREPDAHLGTVFAGLTMGQILSLPMLALGLYLLVSAFRRPPTPKPVSESEEATDAPAA